MIPGVAIVRLAPGDHARFAGLLDMFGEAFEEPDTYGATRPGPDYVDGLLGRDTFIALVAVAAGAVIGGLVAYVLPKFEQARSEVYIYDLAVAASHRRRGVATAMVEALKPLAVGAGASVIFVQAHYPDAPAINLYTKLGSREDVLHFDIPAR